MSNTVHESSGVFDNDVDAFGNEFLSIDADMYE